ncbi:tRNA dimethylallyltransferase [Anopheles cruzii]|uniref:tRNA dimethylallyltransferase n=1 Tax=Anopheles cruzii TaxID=68878 RepID=UPI0022EC6B4E|nr:tRNA dimethylallyltransferase [Anopheles cruzii]
MEQSNKTIKPIVVILGSTGTGKTKLSLELGTRYGGEVISADSMQVYKNLDIVTAKATKDEQKLVKHHMLDVTSIDQAFTVTHFREQALPIIDSLLADERIPIIVGGTNYYIESLLWQILISDGVKRTTELTHCMCIGISALKTVSSTCGGPLMVKSSSRQRTALEVYVESGGTQTMSQMLAAQRAAPGASRLGGSLRYRNVVMLWLQCEQETLDKRLEVRVDSMVSQGLLTEIRAFYKSHVKPYDHCDYHKGVLQSIGFKEFAGYLERYDADTDRMLLEDGEPTLGSAPSEAARLMLADCLNNLKLVTKRYARRQLRWIRNRFLSNTGREVPPIYALDTTDNDQWDANVLGRATAIIDAIVAGRAPPYTGESKIVHQADGLATEKSFECQACQRVIVGEYQWQLHIRSKKHHMIMKNQHRRDISQVRTPCSVAGASVTKNLP